MTWEWLNPKRELLPLQRFLKLSLSRASALVRTRNPAVSTGPDADRARATPLGSRTVRLTNATIGPQAKANTKVEVKGALSALGAEDGVTVMSLQTVGPSCE